MEAWTTGRTGRQESTGRSADILREMTKDTHYKTEAALLARIARALDEKRSAEAAGIRAGIGDDAAVWRPRGGHEVILTTDWFLEGTHFDRERHPADSIGWKCLARAASDVAAMGGEPRCFLLSLALPGSHTSRWLDEFLGGVRRASRQLRCIAAGGDTTRNKRILIGVTVIGEIRTAGAFLRSGARPGDAIFVTGTLGEAELGLKELRARRHGPDDGHRTADSRIRKHLYPVPRLAAGQRLARKKMATAMMDLSDGLSTDLARLCAASGVGAEIEDRRLPLAREIEAERDSLKKRLEAALHGGDDYELLFTVQERIARRIPGKIAGIRVTRIGTITRRRGIFLILSTGKRKRLPARGWDPFH